MANAKLIIIVVLCAVAAIVMFQNSAQVTTKFLFIEIAMPRFVLLAITGVIGFAIGVLVATKKKKHKA